jgi:hypothetical protein
MGQAFLKLAEDVVKATEKRNKEMAPTRKVEITRK